MRIWRGRLWPCLMGCGEWPKVLRSVILDNNTPTSCSACLKLYNTSHNQKNGFYAGMGVRCDVKTHFKVMNTALGLSILGLLAINTMVAGQEICGDTQIPRRLARYRWESSNLYFARDHLRHGDTSASKHLRLIWRVFTRSPAVKMFGSYLLISRATRNDFPAKLSTAASKSVRSPQTLHPHHLIAGG